MKITDINIRPYSSGKMRAWVDVTFDHVMISSGWKVIEGANGLFVSVPSNKKGDEYYPSIKFADMNEDKKSEFKDYLEAEILNYYSNPNATETVQPNAENRTRRARVEGNFSQSNLGPAPPL